MHTTYKQIVLYIAENPVQHFNILDKKCSYSTLHDINHNLPSLQYTIKFITLVYKYMHLCIYLYVNILNIVKNILR